jgi:hypothetical protein
LFVMQKSNYPKQSVHNSGSTGHPDLQKARSTHQQQN